MKKIFVGLITIFLLIMAVFVANKKLKPVNKEIITYKLNGKDYRLLIADEPQEQSLGLMNIRRLDNAQGMIFIFPDSKPRSFWNKNTYLDLDLYWIDNEKVVGKTILPSIEKSKEIVIVDSNLPADKVIEIIK